MKPIPLLTARWAVRRTAEGPYQATVVWVAGCSLRCKGCMNRDLWDREKATSFFVDDALLLAWVALGRSFGDTALVFVGGEPMEQARALAQRIRTVRQVYPDTLITVYSGYTYEALRRDPARAAVLEMIDFLVDGPFVVGLADDNIGYRGSRNQRVIDMRATRQTGRLTLADWDNLVVFTSQAVSAPPALMTQGEVQVCGL